MIRRRSLGNRILRAPKVLWQTWQIHVPGEPLRWRLYRAWLMVGVMFR